jgi:4a-hydroxytetrahydrobiopterin dehydratase
MSETLNQESVQGWLDKHPGWKLKEGSLVREFRFKSFRDTIVFVNRIASLADESGNRPDMDIRGETVRLMLSPSGSGGITQAVIELAQRVDFATSAR